MSDKEKKLQAILAKLAGGEQLNRDEERALLDSRQGDMSKPDTDNERLLQKL